MSPTSKLTSMTVSLPSAQKKYVKARAAATGCSTPSEYIRRLIHADQQSAEEQELERKILAGLDSTAREMSEEDWADMRSTLRRRLASRKRKK